jgi:DNA-binding transcriptional ArsR family regulator
MPAVQSDAASLGTALPSPTKPLNPGDVPPETVTLGQAVVLWSAFDSNVTGLPTSVTWANGYYLDQVGAVNVDPTRVMRYLILTRDDTTPDGAPVTRSLDLDASSGRLEYGETYVQRTSADHWLASINGNHPGPGNLPKYTGPFSPEAAAEVAFSLTFLVYFLPWLRTAAVGLFSRIAGDRLLDHKLREQLVNQVRADPGISAPRLHKTSGAGWSTVVYHLKRLEASGLLASVRDGRHRRYFLANLPAAERTRLTVLRNATTQRVFDLIQQGAPSRVILAQTLGLARPTVTWHLRRLLEAGLVTRFGTGQNITYRPNDQAN